MEKSPKLFLSIIYFFFAIFSGCAQDKQSYLDKAFKYYPQTSKEFRACIEEGIKVHPNDAELWREVATSHFKAGEYAPAMKYINKAVELDPKRWLGYRAFMKCIFMKDYAPAIEDFKQALALKNQYYEMDHTYHFYIAISYLKLNLLDSADHYMAQSLKLQMPDGKGSGHYVDWFYWGLIKYQKKDYKKALVYYDNSLNQYSKFPDAMYYKALILGLKKEKNQAKELLTNAQSALQEGYRLNEANEPYVNYPFQISAAQIQEELKKFP